MAKSALGDQGGQVQLCALRQSCGIEARVSDGVIRAIHPDKARSDYYSWGICPRGASGLFNPYDPNRLKRPMKRTNPVKGMDEDPVN